MTKIKLGPGRNVGGPTGGRRLEVPASETTHYHERKGLPKVFGCINSPLDGGTPMRQ